MEKKTSVLSNGLLWFGAAVSIAEIMTGALFAPLGFNNGLLAILLGHAIGCALFFLAGIIGARTGMSSMESVRISFGGRGSYLFSGLNILQLIGWTAVMLIGGARALGVILDPALGFDGFPVYCVLIGALIIIWVLVGVENLGKLNLLAVGALFFLTIMLSFVVFRGEIPVSAGGGGMSFGAAVELSAAMPLSWLPLISDYTRTAKRPVMATTVSTFAYFAGSCWMYVIGLAAAIFTGNSDVAAIMVSAGVGVAGVLIVLLATVTTTFLDVYSTGVSLVNITKRIGVKTVAVITGFLGILIAIFTPVEQYVSFLYLIGSVFTPMIAILITDFFILKNDCRDSAFSVKNLVIWAAGFVAYRVFLGLDTPVGSSLPTILITSLICIIINKVMSLCLKK